MLVPKYRPHLEFFTCTFFKLFMSSYLPTYLFTTMRYNRLYSISVIILPILFTTIYSNDIAEDTWKPKYGEIIFSAAIFRHADRYPLADFPTNNELTKGIPRNGKLTKPGKERAYNLGVWTRKRYNSLINNRAYNEELLNMISSPSLRCVHSGQLFLSGFYPPTSEENEIWNDSLGLLWQPIPVYTLPKGHRIFSQNEYCARYVAEVELHVKNSPELLGFYRDHKDTIETIKNLGKYKIPKKGDPVIRSIQRISLFYDILETQNRLHFSPPDWTKEIYPRDSHAFIAQYRKIQTWNHVMKRLKGGPILEHVLNELKNKRNNPELQKLFQFYSAHDGKIITLLDMLESWNDNILPDYSSILLFELRKLENEYIVTVSIKYSSDQPLALLNLPRCPNPCTLDKLLDATKNLIPENWEAECKMITPDYNTILF